MAIQGSAQGYYTIAGDKEKYTVNRSQKKITGAKGSLKTIFEAMNKSGENLSADNREKFESLAGRIQTNYKEKLKGLNIIQRFFVRLSGKMEKIDKLHNDILGLKSLKGRSHLNPGEMDELKITWAIIP